MPIDNNVNPDSNDESIINDENVNNENTENISVSENTVQENAPSEQEIEVKEENVEQKEEVNSAESVETVKEVVPEITNSVEITENPNGQVVQQNGTEDEKVKSVAVISSDTSIGSA